MGSHVSLYLVLADPTSLPPGLKIFAEFTLRILDQMHSKHHYGKGKCQLLSFYQLFGFFFYEDVIGPQP